METLATIELSVKSRCFRQRQLAGCNFNACFLHVEMFLTIISKQMAVTFYTFGISREDILDSLSSAACFLSAASSSVFPSVYGQQLAMFKIVMAPVLQAEQNYLVGWRRGGRSK